MGFDAYPLAVKQLQASRGGQKILQGLDLEIRRGDPFAIVGESGSGKTTLLSALTGLIPFEGEIRYGGKSLQELPLEARASTFGLVFQDFQLFPHLTAIDNLLIAPRLRQLGIRKEKAMGLLDELGVAHLASRYPGQMSGGQKQRVAIARSLILEPSFLFLDEPSAALDEKTSSELADTLAKLNGRSQIVAVSHDRPFLSCFASRGIRMDKGMIAASGEIAVLFP